MPGMFFTSWELWQQMTFVLAMGITAVFCAGLGKLWWNNRLMKKREVLDEEKRARVEEMRKTGLPIKRVNPIPFGVRAIQGGVEVDGIWISRPASLNEPGENRASPTPLAGRYSDSPQKERDCSGDERSAVVTTTSLGGSKQSPSAASIFQKLTDTDSVESAQSAARPVSQFAHKAKRQSSRPAGTLNEDTLRRLEGQSPSKPHYETYRDVPTTSLSSSHHHHRNPRQQSSASSSAGSVDSQPRSYTSSHSSKLYMARNPHDGGGHGGVAGRAGHEATLRRWSEKEGRDPFETPARTPSGFSAFSQSETPGALSTALSSSSQQQQQQQQQAQEMAAPEPTFGPGDLHYNNNNNKASRRVNDGFEILPAGTFGVPGQMERAGGEAEPRTHGSRSSNRLRKSGGQLEE
ncbi:hypothetical protein C8A00DRAFT_11044 [Chaetomidium leptoderma]|uniref:Uncharacterized protein n=1 Tax=Chaetomidium leptoderma TaxID=669021 RepID=A0AAN7A1N0_9PEZI|nr:hypothetical protein C8A00DRAFT_11044 [Chaetomidium leptoderma]